MQQFYLYLYIYAWWRRQDLISPLVNRVWIRTVSWDIIKRGPTLTISENENDSKRIREREKNEKKNLNSKIANVSMFIDGKFAATRVCLLCKKHTYAFLGYMTHECVKEKSRPELGWRVRQPPGFSPHFFSLLFLIGIHPSIPFLWNKRGNQPGLQPCPWGRGVFLFNLDRRLRRQASRKFLFK